MLVIFDLDGVLIDTAELIKQAYRDAGVEPPDDILAQEYTDWLIRFIPRHFDDTRQIRDRKNQAYLNALVREDFEYLPPWTTAMMLMRDNIVGILTGAPIGTCLALSSISDRWDRFAIQRDGCKTPEKMRVLREYGKVLPHMHKVYVDDQPKHRDFPEDWTFIQYTTDLSQSLFEKITSFEDA